MTIEITTNIKTRNEEEIIENKNENERGMKKLTTTVIVQNGI